MALTALQTAALIGLGVGSAALGYGVVKQTQRRKALAAPPVCPRGLSPRKVGDQWECRPDSTLEACLRGVFVPDRVPLPATVAALLNENATKTAEQFFGFHLSPEAIEEAYTAFAAAIPGNQEPEDLYFQVRESLMPCNWPGSLEEQLRGWPLDFNYYIDPAFDSERMERAARSLSDLWIVAIAQHVNQYLPVDVDPVMVVSDPERDHCIQADVLSPRAVGAPTSEAVILGALTLAGYDVQNQSVDQVMAQLEAENPVLIHYLEGDWRISREKQDQMWQILLGVLNLPRPVHNTVYNAQSVGEDGSCSWDEKDLYTINMATFWYSAKRLAAIAESAGSLFPVLVEEAP